MSLCKQRRKNLEKLLEEAHQLEIEIRRSLLYALLPVEKARFAQDLEKCQTNIEEIKKQLELLEARTGEAIDRFKEKIINYCQQTFKSDGNSYSIIDIATSIKIDQEILESRLSGLDDIPLSDDYIRSIILALCKFEAIQTIDEVNLLLKIVKCSNFSVEEWSTDPLSRLVNSTLPLSAKLNDDTYKNSKNINNENISVTLLQNIANQHKKINELRLVSSLLHELDKEVTTLCNLIALKLGTTSSNFGQISLMLIKEQWYRVKETIIELTNLSQDLRLTDRRLEVVNSEIVGPLWAIGLIKIVNKLETNFERGDFEKFFDDLYHFLREYRSHNNRSEKNLSKEVETLNILYEQVFVGKV